MTQRTQPLRLFRASLTITLTLVACDERGRDGNAFDLDVLTDMTLAADELLDSPTNQFADDERAAQLGRELFFDRDLSSNGTVACADCHDPELGFTDDRRRSLGTQGQPGTRFSMPVHSVGLQRFFLWDGRADSAWRQPLLAIENAREMESSRLAVAHLVGARYRASYEAIFGALPELEALPPHGKPGDPEWTALTSGQQDQIQRVFVNVGKALEAYERRLVCSETRFDRWQAGELELDAAELEGAERFVGAGCAACHSGPAFSDGGFHDLGLAAPGDLGRAGAVEALLDDELNAAGPYSDAPLVGAEALQLAASEADARGAFRTPTLRGVSQRPRLGHLADHTDLAEFIDDTYRRRGGRGAGRGPDGDDDGPAGLDPLLRQVDLERGDAARIATFLGTLACPSVPAEWAAP